MEKKVYEALKNLRIKAACVNASFAERNIVNIINKKQRQGKKIHFNANQWKIKT